MLIDDDENQRVSLSRVLSSVDCQLEECSSVKEALEKLKVSVPDLIILDLYLPVLDGFAFLKLRNLNKNMASIPVLVLTGVKSKEEIAKAFELGASQVLLKPFVAKTVIKKIEELFAARDAFVHTFSEAETLTVNAEVNAELVELSLGVLKIESRVHLTQGRAVELVAVDYERRDGMPVVGRVDNRMLEPHEHRNRSILFVTGLELNTKRHFESWQRSATSE